MFVIVYQNFVILGPMRWNRFRFENTIFEDCDEFSVTLPDRNDDMTPIKVNDDIVILPIQESEKPPYNPKIEILHGPFWEFTDSVAISTYQAQPKTLEAAKYHVKDIVANKRYLKEIAGTTATIQDVEVTIDTDRNARSNLIHQYLLMNDNDTIRWKVNNDIWLTLTKTEVGTLVNTGIAYVQSQFNWEATIVELINSAAALEELDSINLE